MYDEETETCWRWERENQKTQLPPTIQVAVVFSSRLLIKMRHMQFLSASRQTRALVPFHATTPEPLKSPVHNTGSPRFAALTRALGGAGLVGPAALELASQCSPAPSGSWMMPLCYLPLTSPPARSGLTNNDSRFAA